MLLSMARSRSTSLAVVEEGRPVGGDQEALSTEGSWALFDSLCRTELGLSGEQFLRQYRAGELVDDDEPENWAVGRLALYAALFD